MFALFEDVMLSCCETAGYVRFALFTSGYGYSPPSATLWQATKSSARTFYILSYKIKKRDRYSCGTRVSWSLFYFFSALG